MGKDYLKNVGESFTEMRAKVKRNLTDVSGKPKIKFE